MLVLSYREHNRVYGLLIAVPITRQIKGYGIELLLPDSTKIEGVVLCNQIQTLDWRRRRSEYVDSVEDEFLNDVLERIKLLIDK